MSLKLKGKRRAAFALIGSAAILASITACSGLTPGGTAPSSSAVAGKVLTSSDVTKLGKVTLNMLDYESSPGLGVAITDGIKKFEAKYPNVTVKRSTKAFADYGKVISLTMSSANAPDIAESNATAAQTLVPAKLILPLDNYFTGYGWNKQYPTSVLESLRLSANGKTFGSGNYWGQTPGGNMVGIYYNKTKLTALGLTEPKTLADLESDMAKAKAAGEVPMQLGNLEQWPANHDLSTLLNDFSKPSSVNDWVNGKPGSSFDNAGNLEALTTLKGWWDKGYLNPQANGTKDADAAAAFAAGTTGVFYLSGTWHMSAIDSALGSKAGFFSLPPKTAGGQTYATGSIAAAFTISSKSKHADLAAYFLNFLSSPAMSKTNLVNGYLPFTGDASASGAVTNDVLAAWRDKVKNDGLVGYLDSATPSMGNTLFPGIQSVFGGQMTPQQLLTAVQANWAETHG